MIHLKIQLPKWELSQCANFQHCMIKANPVHAPMRIQNVSHLVLTFAVKIERTENQLPKQASSWRLI